MNPENLIRKLSVDLKSVQVFRYKPRDYALILLCGFFSLGGGLAFTGIRTDIQNVMFSYDFLLQTFLLVTLAVASTLSAMQMSIPSIQTRKAKTIVISTLSLWFAGLIYLLFSKGTLVFGWGIACSQQVAINSVIPALIVFTFVRSAATLNRRGAGWFVLIAGGAVGALATHFSCSDSSASHLLVWHAFPLFLLGIVGLGLGTLFLKKL